jgi:hypothetical protein
VLTLTPQQAAILEKLLAAGFEFVGFPLYPNTVGVKKGNCAGLLSPVESAGLKVFGEPCYLLEGQLSVRVTRGAKKLYVWKKKELEATPEREAEVAAFRQELLQLLS